MALYTMLEKLPPHYQATLLQISEQTGISAKNLIMASIQSTLSYYQQHGTFCLVTAKAHNCHGCRFLPKFQGCGPDPSALNVLPGPWPG